ncbi:Serine/threonine-protein kinase PknD [uncultured archaeon]|nr:Serine/threonine-protein kinase PknD [uncultured archaeon]
MRLDNSMDKSEKIPWNSSDFSGRTIAGHRIVKKLGEGGFGAVYLAEKDGKSFALKFLKEKKSKLVYELKNEFRLASSIDHPNVIKVHEFNSTASFEGRGFETAPFIVMDYFDGLEALDVTKIENDDFYKIFTQMVDGLGAVHYAGLIHKDLKPNNVLVMPDDQVKITDFGLGKAISDDLSLSLRQSLSMAKETGGLEGTLGYFPNDPEEHEHSDQRFDLYSLGVIAYQMLLGDKKFPAVDALDDIRRACEKRDFSEQESSSLGKIIIGLLKKRDSRYQSIDELRNSNEYHSLGARTVSRFDHTPTHDELSRNVYPDKVKKKITDIGADDEEPGEYHRLKIVVKDEHSVHEKPLPRRGFLQGSWAKIIELCSLLPVCYFGVKGLISRKEYPQVRLNPSDVIKEYEKGINQFEGCFASVKNDLDNLWSLYKRHYYKSETVTEAVPTIDAEGNPSVTTQTRTEYYWEVPSGLPSSGTVSDWRDKTENLVKRISEVKKQPLFDYSENKFQIKKEKANFAVEAAVLACAYGSLGAALMFYEEGIEWLSKFWDGDFKASNGMTRRNILKLGAVTAASVPVYLISQNHAEQSNARFAEADEEVKRILDSVRNASNETVISDVTGASPAYMVKAMNDYAAAAQSAVQRGVNENDVASTFSSLQANAQVSRGNLQRIFSSIPDEIALPMRNAYGLKQIGEFNSHGSRGIILDHLVETGAFAGILAVILGAGEPFFQASK